MYVCMHACMHAYHKEPCRARYGPTNKRKIRAADVTLENQSLE